MDKKLEEIIVKSFFTKRLQNRVLFELSSSKKRKDAIGRLCHNYRTTLREEYMIEIPKPNSCPIDIGDLLKKHGAVDSCYAILWDTKIDGKTLPLLDALEAAVGMGMPSILYSITNQVAYFEAEQETLPSPRFILKRTY
ncbi:TPA: hypothetical protein QCY38_004575 [Bacillus toyonensis]|uniref:hypothetical protein n=1 Tax=Bacillus toyonensis TaxID=155322 RepID=UPI00028B3BA1|nr:hypothetical protein [Bacillus toyonensis]AFU13424.1 hypothetical protein MC28_2002 [Bacillus thuringiensis MC28]OTW76033.1 hypothetical protein BK702_30900 [Bacillus thuringiensis serovar cameroun]OTX00340.1 hypothetical protein BK712_31520 [Bacillus thuringiensis serovar seoulensis]QPW48242.1 hypothetical protein G9298_10845 [Bacillus thuringiensis]MCA1046632.1 hypothetical protein [Bacillus toyonensis]